MSWYIMPSGQPWYATDGSSLARALVADGALLLADADVAAARAAWDARVPGPGGLPADWATQQELLAYLRDAEAAATAADSAKADAVAAVGLVQREQAGGVAGLDGSGKLYEARVPDRLSDVSLSAGFARNGRSVGRRSRDLLSMLGDRIIVGGNVVPTPAQVAGGPPAWALLWKGIVEDDGTRKWVTDQLDFLAGPLVAGNTVRVIGAAGHIWLGTYFTREEYLGAVKWFCDYATTKGLMIYPSLIGDWRDFSADFTPSYPGIDAKADLLAVAQLLDTYGNVIGLDLCNEYTGHAPAGKTGYDNLAQVESLMNDLIRPAGVSLPLTASLAVFDAPNLAGSGSEEADTFDFLDRHIYFNAGVPIPAQIASLSSLLRTRAHTDTPLLIGEANLGGNVFAASTNEDRAAYIDALAELCTHSRVAGFLTWAIADQGTTADLKYGLYSGLPGATPVARVPQCAAIKRAPRRRQGNGITRWLVTDLAAPYNAMTDIVLTGNGRDVGGFLRGQGNSFITVPEAGTYQVTFGINFSTSDVTANAAYDAWVYVPDPLTGDRDERIVSIRDSKIAGGMTSTRTVWLAADTTLAASIYVGNTSGGGPATIMAGDTRTFVSVARVGP